MQPLNVIFDNKKPRQKQLYKKTENAERLIEAAAGYSNEDIAKYLSVRPNTVSKFLEIAEETLGILDALASGYSYKTIADYLRVRRETVNKPVEIAEETIEITKEDLPDENMIAKYFDNVRPNIPNVQFLNDDHIVKIRACLHAGCPATSIDKYLNKTPGTINRWKNEGRFDDSVIREAERRSRRKNINPDNPDSFAAKLEELKQRQEERQWQAPADEIGRLKNEIQQCEQRARNYEMQLEQEKGEISRLKARLNDIRRMINL